MCLAIPGKIIEIKDKKAKVDYDGLVKDADLSLIDVEVGDYIIVNAGFAILKIDEDNAKKSLKLFREMK